MKTTKLLLVVLMLAAPTVGFAANDCAASVALKNSTKGGSGWVLAFNVKTSCEGSTGRFIYTYVDDRGRTIERRSPSWTPSDGKSFVLKDEIAEPGAIKSLAVKAGSVESAKNP